MARQSDEALHVDLLAEVDLENAQCRVAVAGDRRHSDVNNDAKRVMTYMYISFNISTLKSSTVRKLLVESEAPTPCWSLTSS